MQFPVDTSAIKFISERPAVPHVDFDTKAQKLDPEGRPVFLVPLYTSGTETREAINVKVTGEPKGLGELQYVKVIGLVATTWQMGERSGVSFRAERIETTIKAAA